MERFKVLDAFHGDVGLDVEDVARELGAAVEVSIRERRRREGVRAVPECDGVARSAAARGHAAANDAAHGAARNVDGIARGIAARGHATVNAAAHGTAADVDDIARGTAAACGVAAVNRVVHGAVLHEHGIVPAIALLQIRAASFRFAAVSILMGAIFDGERVAHGGVAKPGASAINLGVRRRRLGARGVFELHPFVENLRRRP